MAAACFHSPYSESPSTMTMQPSTQWQEKIAPDEAERFARYGEQFVALQARKSKRYGNGRALHRKQITAASGTLQVLSDLPEFARQGLFAKAGTHEVWARLSNGGMDRAPDRMPDIRGFRCGYSVSRVTLRWAMARWSARTSP